METETHSKPEKAIDPFVWTIRIIALAFFTQMYLSLNLWFPTTRTYPIIPSFSSLSFELGQALTALISAAFLFFLSAAATLQKYQKQALFLSLSCLSILVLEDINRFQAWVYIYVVLLAIIFWHLARNEGENKALANLQFVMAMVYFWTGAQKMNVQFVQDVYPWLARIFELTNPLADYLILGYGIGLFEIVIGLCLLHNQTLRIAVVLGIMLHFGILILLIKDQWNSVVYPWNVAMMVLLWILFWVQKKQTNTFIFSEKRPSYFILFLFGLIPFLDFFQVVPHNLALGMYSGTSLECNIVMKDYSVADCLPESLWSELSGVSEKESDLSLDDWAIQELNIPPFASKRVFLSVAKKVCACTNKNNDSWVELYQPYRWNNSDKIDTLTCRELLMRPI